MPPNKAHGHDNVYVRPSKLACNLLSVATGWRTAMVNPMHKSDSKEALHTKLQTNFTAAFVVKVPLKGK